MCIYLRLTLLKGYGAGVVDAHEDGHAAHHARPLPLEAVRLPHPAVDAGVQQADDSWGGGRDSSVTTISKTPLKSSGSTSRDEGAILIHNL